MTSLIRSTSAGFILALVLQSSPTLAQDALPPATGMPAQEGMGVPRLDIGATVGWNNPGGIYGVETDYRLFKSLGRPGGVMVGLSGGIALF